MFLLNLAYAKFDLIIMRIEKESTQIKIISFDKTHSGIEFVLDFKNF